MMWRRTGEFSFDRIFFVLFMASSILAVGQTPDLRFRGDLYQTHPGGRVIFYYLPEISQVSLDQVGSWSWDFDGEGVVDNAGSILDGDDPIALVEGAIWDVPIDFNPRRQQNGIGFVEPVLTIITTD